MKSKLFIIVGFVGFLMSCSKKPADMAYIVNDTDFTIMWYSDIDSLPILPQKKVFIGEILVEDNQIISWRDYYFRFNENQTLTKLGLVKDEIYEVYNIADEHASILMDINNYLHHFLHQNLDKYRLCQNPFEI